jgi:hypothetical protein
MTLNENQGVEDVDVDALLQGLDQPAPERPMTGEGDAVAPPVEAAKEELPPPIAQEFEFDWSGKKIKAPIDMILSKYAPMGYDYAQRMQAFKAEQAQKAKELEEQYKPYERYKQVDEYARKDPQWWQHVEQSYQDRLNSEDPNVVRLKSVLEEELKPFKEILTQQEQAKEQEKVTKEDSALAEEMKSIREKYSDLDFDAPDAEGKSLDLRIIEHGVQHGIKSYKTAFLDFYHDQLEKRAEARGREANTKEVQKRTKLGLSASTPTPKKALDEGFDVKGKSYNDILNEVTERLGL